MKFDDLMRSAFERDAEKYRAEIPAPRRDVPLLPDTENRGRERYGALILCIAALVLVSVFSLRTGIFRNSWNVPLAGMIKLPPENPGEAFRDFLRAVNSSL